MPNHQPRMTREQVTVEAMIGIYCRGQHANGDSLCTECEALAEYARLRLQKCPFQQAKPTCAKCPIHCYTPDMRGKVRDVMRYAGPRMMVRHPVLAVQHLLDGRRDPSPIHKAGTAQAKTRGSAEP